MKPTRRSAGDASRLNRVASRRSSLRFGRNTPGPVLPVGAPPSRALSAGRFAGLGAHVGSITGCSPRRFAPLIVAFRSEYTGASSPGGGSSLTRLVSRAPRRPRRSVGSITGCSPRRFAPLIVAFRSEYTGASSPGGGSSLTRLVSRAPRRPRRSRGFHHRLFTASLRAAHRCVSVGIHRGQFSRWGLLPHAPCQPGASPASALPWVPPPAVHHSASLRSVLRFGRNTPGISPSRALSAGRLAPTGRTGQARRSPGFHHRLLAVSDPGFRRSGAPGTRWEGGNNSGKLTVGLRVSSRLSSGCRASLFCDFP